MKALPTYWATPEDFATLFQYFWHRDLPIDLKSTGARRIDWTIHIGIIVRSIADLMGIVCRFERGGRKDALLRSVAGDEIAIEWEWDGIYGNELDKLRAPDKIWHRYDGERKLKYAVLITYTDSADLEGTINHATKYWKDAEWPLLLILIISKKTKVLAARREFTNLQMYLIDKGKQKLLRDVPAMPWNVDCTRWQFQLLDQST